MGQTLFQRVKSQNFLTVAAEEDPYDLKPAEHVVGETSRQSSMADVTKASTEAFTKKSSLATVSSLGVRTQAYKMETHKVIKN